MDFDLKISLQRHRSRVQRLMCRSAIGRLGEILSSRTFELDFIVCRMMQNKPRVSSFCKVQIRFLIEQNTVFILIKLSFFMPSSDFTM